MVKAHASRAVLESKRNHVRLVVGPVEAQSTWAT